MVQGKYTIKGKKVDQVIQRHLDAAVEELKKIKNIGSILLVGGFAQGEGSVVIENGRIIPVNDYDLYVLVDKKLGEDLLNKIARKIEKGLGSSGYSLYEHSKKSFYFDIRQLKISDLPKLAPLAKYYQLKHASQLLYGKDYRNMIKITKKDIPLSDPLRFLFNRMSHMIEWFPVDDFKKEKMLKWKRETLLYDISKAYMECCTALVLLKGKYAPTYRGRTKNLKKIYNTEFPELANKYPELIKRIEYFTKIKVEPKYAGMDHVKIWFEAKEHLFAVAEFYMKSMKDCDLYDFYPKISEEYLRPYSTHFLKNRLGTTTRRLVSITSFAVQFYLRLLWFVRIAKHRHRLYFRVLLPGGDPGLQIFSALPFLMESIDNEGEINGKNLQKAYSNLRRIYPTKVKIGDNLETFDQLREEYSDAWRLYFFQKIGG
ncbi:hypothetical protein ACFLQI_02490 [Candidatus Undinarchaeota archaeon]